jgi:hypothetical protein
MKYIQLFLIALLAFACSEESEEVIQDLIQNETNLVYYSSSENNVHINRKTDNYGIKFTSNRSKKGEILISTLQILNSENKIILETNFSIDKTVIHYKLKQSDKVIEAARDLYTKSSSINLQEITTEIEGTYEELNSLENSSVNKELLEMLYFHTSILNVRNRMNLSNRSEDCGCLTHPGYLVGSLGFFCQEDYKLNTESLIDIIQENPESFQDQPSQSLLQFLLTVNSENISYDEYYNFYYPIELYITTLENIENENRSWCPLGQGSDPGCCGNYSGCCLFWSANCLAHDLACWNCWPNWFCGPQCQPE